MGNILGYTISNKSLNGNVAAALDIIKQNHKGYVACMNPHSYIVALKDTLFSESLKKANILLPDGTGIIIASNILNGDIKKRVAGYEFFEGLSSATNRNGKVKHFFLGSSETVLNLIREKFELEYKNIQLVGTYSPPYKNEFDKNDTLKMIDAVNHAEPDILWVGMTAPKQEKWIYENIDQLDVNIACAIGAVFDFYAGTISRSPKWAIKYGLEWLPRLIREPARLFKRNFISSPQFLYCVFREKLSTILSNK